MNRVVRSVKERVSLIFYASLLAIMAPPAHAFWPFTATQENPFAGRSFIADWEGSYDTGTRLDVYVFDTDTAVTIDTLNLHFYGGIAINQHGEQMIRKGRHSTPYEVDYEKRKIRFAGNREYVYSVDGGVIRLKSAGEQINLYEVDQPAFFLTGADSDPDLLAKHAEYWDILRNRGVHTDNWIEQEAASKRNTIAIRNYFDNLVAKAKGAPPVELPTITPTPTSPTPIPTPTVGDPPSPPPPVINVTNVTVTNVTVTNVSLTNVAVTNEEQTVVVQYGSDKEGGDSGEEKKDDPTPGNPPKQPTVDDLVNGQYLGSFVNETKGTTMKFDLRIVPLCEPAGNPPKARISGVINFEDGRSDRGLQGEAVYADKTTFTLGWNNSTGTVAYNGTLEGDNLRGSWRMDGANGEKSNGTFEAVRTGP